MKFLITGAEMGNKGAQSMFFISISELRDRFYDCEIFYGAWDNYDVSNLRVHRLSISLVSLNMIFKRMSITRLIIRIIKDFVKLVVGKSDDFLHYNDLKKVMPEIDAIIDVSGFLMGKKWSIDAQERWLDYIRLAKQYNIPIYYMPQSFGPFGYDKEEKYAQLYRDMKDLMPYASVIFAREDEGELALKEEFSLKNVVRSEDLVLQNKAIKLENVFKNVPQISVPELPSKKCVGIVPNQQCFNYGNINKIIELYRQIIIKLVSDGYDVVIFHHSKDDQKICVMLKNIFPNERVYLEKKEFSCIEYDTYVRKFDFIICSRFHGLVHAYRNGVPGIALGWAIKYNELTQLMDQVGYSFNITEDIKINDVLESIEKMENNFEVEKKRIKKRIQQIQQNNCFDVIH